VQQKNGIVLFFYFLAHKQARNLQRTEPAFSYSVCPKKNWFEKKNIFELICVGSLRVDRNIVNITQREEAKL